MGKMQKNNFLSKLKKSLSKTLTINYSCESLNDSNKAYTPRITSIAVHNVESESSHSFAIHLEAEILKVPPEKIESNYDYLEKNMLKNFYEFVKEHQAYYWLHWNMRGIQYGFETLAHRYKVLGASDSEIYDIPAENRFNLSGLILCHYGEDCVDSKARMERLMELNGGIPQDYLSLADEAKAFQNKEYQRMHASTDCKVRWFGKMLEWLLEGTINTDKSNSAAESNSAPRTHKACDSSGKNHWSCIENWIDEIENSPLRKFLGWIATLIGIFPK